MISNSRDGGTFKIGNCYDFIKITKSNSDNTRKYKNQEEAMNGFTGGGRGDGKAHIVEWEVFQIR